MAPESEDYKQHWEEKFRSQSWGRYPPEDLVRFVGRRYGQGNRSDVSVLEIGCGPGANLWFLHREGFQVSGIDGAPTAIAGALARLESENQTLNAVAPDLRVGDFKNLPWGDGSFDFVIDIFAIYANTLEVIQQAIGEVHRVLKPGGRFYSKLWGRNTAGYGEGREIERGTYDDIASGPCCNMGVSHFFDQEEIENFFSLFEIDAIDIISRTDSLKGPGRIEEYMCQFRKKAS